ncbi:MAG: peptidylprolyl isomerase, partial [Pseudomonadota bacterium]
MLQRPLAHQSARIGAITPPQALKFIPARRLHQVCRTAFVSAFGAFLLAALLSAPARAMGIAAVVNDEIISEYDLSQRIALFAVSSGVDVSRIQQQELRSQILRTLIDESLKLQEATRLEVDVEEDDLLAAKEQIASRNGTSVSQIESVLNGAGISTTTFDRQLRAEILWTRLVGGRFRSQIAVTDAQIDSALQEIEQTATQPQFLVSEIFLAVDRPQDEAAVRRSADGLLGQLQNGVPFQILARQFSQSASAINGGDIGWVRADQVPQEVSQAIQAAPVGGVSPPIRAPGGFYIVGVRDRRALAQQGVQSVQLDLRHVLYPLDANANIDDAVRVARQLQAASQGLETCGDVESIAQKVSGAEYAAMGNVDLNRFPPDLREQIMALQAGQISSPIRSNVGFHVFGMC